MASRGSAIIIATSEYEDRRLPPLKAPVGDAERLARVLGDPDIGDLDVTLLVNRAQPEVMRELERFLITREHDEMVVLHFACHGIRSHDDRLYLAATDTDEDHLESTSVPADFLHRQLARCPSKAIVLILDCCYSGAYGTGFLARARGTVDIERHLRGEGRVVMASSAAVQLALEDAQGSLFTAALVDGLTTGAADENGDQWVGAGELFRYAQARVHERRPMQKPKMWAFDVTDDVRLARVPGAVEPAPKPLPDEVTHMLASSREDVRVAAVAVLRGMATGDDRGLARSARKALLTVAAQDDAYSVADAAESAYVAIRESEGAPPARAPTARRRTVPGRRRGRQTAGEPRRRAWIPGATPSARALHAAVAVSGLVLAGSTLLPWMSSDVMYDELGGGNARFDASMYGLLLTAVVACSVLLPFRDRWRRRLWLSLVLLGAASTGVAWTCLLFTVPFRESLSLGGISGEGAIEGPIVAMVASAVIAGAALCLILDASTRRDEAQPVMRGDVLAISGAFVLGIFDATPQDDVVIGEWLGLAAAILVLAALALRIRGRLKPASRAPSAIAMVGGALVAGYLFPWVDIHNDTPQDWVTLAAALALAAGGSVSLVARSDEPASR